MFLLISTVTDFIYLTCNKESIKELSRLKIAFLSPYSEILTISEQRLFQFLMDMRFTS